MSISTGTGARGPTGVPAIAQLEPLPLRHLRRGKVREVYVVDDRRLLLVATDRVSAFDVVMNEPIPYKGAVLTQITAWWLRQLERDVHHHMISADVDEIVSLVPQLAGYRSTLSGRAMLCKRTTVFPVECVIRGYLSGSAWKEYKKSGTMHGATLPTGLEESSQLPEPVFTPSTKAAEGHDENISFERAVDLVGKELAEKARDVSLELYTRGAAWARERGIIIADTKFELGLVNGERRSSKVCTSNPDLRKLVATDALAQFEKDPARDSVSVDPSDGGGWCECPECKHLGSVSDRALTLANEVAAAVHAAATRPDDDAWTTEVPYSG